MSDSVYFEGDPETDSTRRRMERVLKGVPPRSRWPWIAAALGSGADGQTSYCARAGDGSAAGADGSVDGVPVDRRSAERIFTGCHE